MSEVFNVNILLTFLKAYSLDSNNASQHLDEKNLTPFSAFHC